MQNLVKSRVLIIGAGLAGSEAAMYLAKNNVEVVLVESKKLKLNPRNTKIRHHGVSKEFLCTVL